MTPRKPAAVVLRAQSDQRLVALARSGSEAAFEALVRRHRQELVLHCRRLLLPEGGAEDAVQQALLSAWQALRAGEEVQHPRAWLHRIAHNRALDARKRSGYDHLELQASLQGGELPQEELERRTVVRETLAGLARLPEIQRDVLLRTAVHGDSYDAVAQDLAVPESTVRGMLHRARGTLRAAATAITPGPLVAWAAAAGPAAPAVHGMAEGLTLGGSAGLAGLGAKLAAVTVVAGGVVGGLATQQGIHRPSSATAAPGASSRAHHAAQHHRSVAPAVAAAPVSAVPNATPAAFVTPPTTSLVHHGSETVHAGHGRASTGTDPAGSSSDSGSGSSSGSGSGSGDEGGRGRPAAQSARPPGDAIISGETKTAHQGDRSSSSDEATTPKPDRRSSSGDGGGDGSGDTGSSRSGSGTRDRSGSSATPTVTAPSGDDHAPSGDKAPAAASAPTPAPAPAPSGDGHHAADEG